MPKNKQSQSGSVFIYILVAVALFAMIMFTVSKGSNTSSSVAMSANDKILASELIETSKTIQNAVQKLFMKGCSENEISFENAFVTGYANSNSPSSGDKRCWVFDIAGGNVKWPKSSPGFSTTNADFTFTGANFVKYLNNTSPYGSCSGSASCMDLVMFITNVPKTLCKEINKQLNVTTTAELPTEVDTISSTKFTGSFSTGSSAFEPQDGAALIKTAPGFCYVYSGANNTFAYVLHAR